jgi:hypothetical protein
MAEVVAVYELLLETAAELENIQGPHVPEYTHLVVYAALDVQSKLQKRTSRQS